MKKFIILIFAMAIIFTVLFAGCNTENDDLMTKDEFIMQHWMSYIKDDVKIGDIVMPGSHDAGTKGANTVWQTQKSDMAEQLASGVRYFDTRVAYNSTKKANMFIHADSNNPKLPMAFGLDFEKALNDIKSFIGLNPDEVIILDFQHTWDSDEEGVLQQLTEVLGTDCILSRQDAQNPSQVTLGQMRGLGKNIIIIYKDGNDALFEEYDFLFSREQFLQSEYNRTVHNSTADNLIAEFDNYFENKKDDVFFVLQSQLSSGVLEDREVEIRDKANLYLRNLVKDGNADKLAKINIVMRDFIADDLQGAENSLTTVNSILILNVDKGNIKDDMLERYKLSTDYQTLIA